MSQPINQSIQLSCEQEFSLKAFEVQVEQMSREQAQSLLVNLYRQMILRDTMFKQILKHQWGIDSGSKLS